MKWLIAAKTFLIGEYVALRGEPALLMTTTPCFELTLLRNQAVLVDINNAAPAARLWSRYGALDHGLHWHDPYQGIGGMGASSAQFLSTYLACKYLHSPQHLPDILTAYYECAWEGEGIRPSGYDVIAQSLQGCVYIDKNQDDTQVFNWPFADISCLLFHTGKKLATHQHLEHLQLDSSLDALTQQVRIAHEAFKTGNAQLLIQAINAYHVALKALGWVEMRTVEMINKLTLNKGIVAAKGCGAMGADIILLLVARENQNDIRSFAESLGLHFMASLNDLHPVASLK